MQLKVIANFQVVHWYIWFQFMSLGLVWNPLDSLPYLRKQVERHYLTIDFSSNTCLLSLPRKSKSYEMELLGYYSRYQTLLRYYAADVMQVVFRERKLKNNKDTWWHWTWVRQRTDSVCTCLLMSLSVFIYTGESWISVS